MIFRLGVLQITLVPLLLVSSSVSYAKFRVNEIAQTTTESVPHRDSIPFVNHYRLIGAFGSSSYPDGAFAVWGLASFQHDASLYTISYGGDRIFPDIGSSRTSR